MTSSPNSEYADVTDMLRHLMTLDEQSNEYRRQREAIIARCLPLADHIARRFGNRGEARDDLVQVARMGLVQAVNRFDAEHGAEFLAFAVPTMMGEVRRYFRDHGWSVKVPRRMKELGPQLNKARDELFQEVQRAPTASEIAERLGIDREEVVQAQIASSAYSTLSYDTPGYGVGDDEGRSLSDSVGFVDANLDKVVDVETVRPLLAALPAREQTVLMFRFFENMTQSQIAERLGISQMHVSRLLARSLAALREQVSAPAQAGGRTAAAAPPPLRVSA
ncbi:MAG: SigB/SigF/SigG family RNA polymerase sigma factor [Mycobacterium sp.]|nr:SigB/SigF/SigG family RNA polymerase sigma factor [Mycobacterium sp.]